MKQSHTKPPNWDKLVELFGVSWGKTVVTYGDTCYCANPLSLDLEVHEAVHAVQQSNPVEWWDRYYVDKEFRLSQEIEAYKAQTKFLRKYVKDRNQLHRRLDSISRDLSGAMYGNCISYDEAYRRIK